METNKKSIIDIYKSIRKPIPKPTCRHTGKSRKQERHEARETLRRYKGSVRYDRED